MHTSGELEHEVGSVILVSQQSAQRSTGFSRQEGQLPSQIDTENGQT